MKAILRSMIVPSVLGLGILSAGAARVAGQVVIDFDDLAVGQIVTNQYPEAAFSSNPGFVNRVQELTERPRFLCTGPVEGGIDCTHDTFVDFTLPVNDLTFIAVGANESGVVGGVNVFENSSFSDTLDVIQTEAAWPPPPVFVDLTAFSDITRIEMVNITDFGGLGWDDFTFTPIPEPATVSVVPDLASLGLISERWRRKRSLVSNGLSRARNVQREIGPKALRGKAGLCPGR